MTKGKRPLDGVKVIDFTRVYAGPYCTMMLADLGAEVIKIEKQGTGDDTHDFAPVQDGESGYFTYLNRNKKSLSLNLKSKEAIEIIKELATWADIVVENFSPGVVDRLGVGYDDLKAINPRIIYGSISGFGQSGPYSRKPAYDLVCQAMGGYMTITGEADGKPYKLGTSIADAAAGIHMAYALMAALYYREKTGVGQFIDVAMMDTVFSTLENFVVTKTLTGTAPSRNGNANLGSAPFNLYNTKDGYVTIACANNKLFEKLTTAIDKRDLLMDPRYKENSLRKKNEITLNKSIEEWSSQHTTKEVCNTLEAAGIPVGPILTIDELVEDPHLKARNMLVDIPHPIFGTIRYPGNPIKYSETSDLRFKSAPLLGEHNEEILKNILHKSAEEFKELEEKGIF
jgi:CoA:oxalate CoA-transferase